MASIPDDTLRKARWATVLQQLQQQVVSSQKQLVGVRAQMQAKERDRRLTQLTLKELEGIQKEDKDVKVYKGVGKMFMQEQAPSIVAELEKKEKELADDLNNLQKKAKYLEKAFNEAQGNLRDIFRSVEIQQAQRA